MTEECEQHEERMRAAGRWGLYMLERLSPHLDNEFLARDYFFVPLVPSTVFGF